MSDSLIESTCIVLRKAPAFHESLKHGRVLLLKRADKGSDTSLHGKWGFPGGKIEEGESPFSAIMRECREEIGISLGLYTQIGPTFSIEFPPYRIHVWPALVTSDFDVTLNEEHTRHRWIRAIDALKEFEGHLAGPGTSYLLHLVAAGRL